MDNVIAVFNNRNQSMQFASMLKKMGVANKTINTPRELSVSCGISVVFSMNNIKQAEYVLKSYNFGAFVGLYRIKSGGFIKKYQPI